VRPIPAHGHSNAAWQPTVLGRPKAAEAAQPTEENWLGRPVPSGAAERARAVVTTTMTGVGGDSEPGVEVGHGGRGEHQRWRGNSPGKVGGDGAHPKDGSSTRRPGGRLQQLSRHRGPRGGRR
jgi:hypothetical protein